MLLLLLHPAVATLLGVSDPRLSDLRSYLYGRARPTPPGIAENRAKKEEEDSLANWLNGVDGLRTRLRSRSVFLLEIMFKKHE